MPIPAEKQAILDKALANPEANTSKAIISKARERGWLGEDNKPVEAPPPVSKTESFLRGAAQGATLKFGDELSAGVELGLGKLTGNEAFKGKTFADLVGENRQLDEISQKTNPKSFLGGDVFGGAVATAPLTAVAMTSKAGTAAKIARAAKEGAAIGATSAAGENATPGNVVQGAVSGALLSAVGESLANVKEIGKAIKQSAAESGLSAIGFGTPALRRMRTRKEPLAAATKVAEDLINLDIINKPGTLKVVHKRVVNALDDVGKQIGDAYQAIDNNIINRSTAGTTALVTGPTFGATGASSGIVSKDAIISNIRKSMLNEQFPDAKAVKSATREVENLLSKYKADHKFSFTDIWELVKKIDDKTRIFERSGDPGFESSAFMLDRASKLLREGLGNVAKEVDPSVADDIIKLGGTYRSLSAAENALSDQILKIPAANKNLAKGSLWERIVANTVGAMPVRTSEIGAKNFLGKVAEGTGDISNKIGLSFAERAAGRGAAGATIMERRGR